MYSTPRKTPKSKPQAVNICWPILDLDEILTILAGFELNLSEDQLLKPTQQVAETIYLRLVSSLLGLDLEQVAQAFSQCSAQTQNESSLYDGFVLFAVQKSIFTLFQDCGVHDFCMDDMLNPTPKRLQLLLSAFINYARFRECREDWAIYMKQAFDEESAMTHNRAQEQSRKKERVQKLRRMVSEISLEQELLDNEAKKAELNKLADINVELMAEKNAIKPKLKAAVARLDQQQLALNKLGDDIFALRSTLAQDPVSLRRDADLLHQHVAHKKYISNSIHERAQKLDISIQALKQFKADMDSLKGAAHNLCTEKNRLQEIHDRHLRLYQLCEQTSLELETRHRDARRSQHECDQLEQKIHVVKHQMEKLNHTTETRMGFLRKQLGVEYGEKALVLQNIDILNEDIAAVGVASAAMREAYMSEYNTAVSEAKRAQASLQEYVAKLQSGVL
ncbi:putative kinetochore protein [Yarrowia sp. B02]|nr:putative kinetochore protein [Yarrowia sp. B02]